MSGYDRSPDYGGKQTWVGTVQALALLVLVTFVMGWTFSAPTAQPTISPGITVNNIYWSDGDSGRINGTPFRLANVDAPETGGVGAVGGAKCESERALGYAAKAFIVELTRNAEITVAADYGVDRYDRLVVDLDVNGRDLGETAIAAGQLGPWPHRGQKALQPKPNWCG